MDNVNFVSTSSIFDNLNLHVKPMDSSTKNAMDTKRVHRKNGGEKQKETESIQQHSSSVQDKPPYFQQSQWASKANNIEGEWGHDHCSNPIGCSLLPVHDQFKLPKGNSKEKNKKKPTGITFSGPRPNKEENKEKSKGKSQEISKTGGITHQHQDQICQWMTIMEPLRKFTHHNIS
ncbi:hypothetical protein C1646_754049 [Rhizophagus diaphanus]|nr:hypothetical protein C1646_754049 [Rhizophagus diaphanus] [Rhizophagus sp. MUCL 43196]